MFVMRLPAYIILAVLLVLTITTKSAQAAEGKTVGKPGILPMIGSIMEGDLLEVRRLAAQHQGLEERNPDDQSTPLVAAARVDQWRMVESLIDNGANIWTHDQFGITAAQRTLTSRVLRGSDDDAARVRIIEKLKARGYPYPPPNAEEVLALDKAGKWPPKEGAN